MCLQIVTSNEFRAAHVSVLCFPQEKNKQQKATAIAVTLMTPAALARPVLAIEKGVPILGQSSVASSASPCVENRYLTWCAECDS